jgi:hypothetical protein
MADYLIQYKRELEEAGYASNPTPDESFYEPVKRNHPDPPPRPPGQRPRLASHPALTHKRERTPRTRVRQCVGPRIESKLRDDCLARLPRGLKPRAETLPSPAKRG